MTQVAMGPLPIIDADSHVTEPPDVWTSRVPQRFQHLVPQVDLHPQTGHNHWRIGDAWFWPVAGGLLTQAGWPEHVPSQPFEYEEADPGAFDPVKRLERMDEYGIDIQLLYPNLIGFAAMTLIPLGIEVSSMIVRAYNDFIWEWSAADRGRLVPMAMIPFWDTDAAIAELGRCADVGFRGILFANKFEKIGLPSFVDPYWDKIYDAVQALDLPINYHVGFGDREDMLREEEAAKRRAANTEELRQAALRPAVVFMSQNYILGEILTSGVCERFPRLKFVNVETGFGHIPFYLEALDWHFRVYGNPTEMRLPPSEYFRRQCYGTYWFEKDTLRLLDLFPDNFMFSTDYPHSTSLAPGPGGATEVMPADYVADAHKELSPEIRDKACFGNANAIYKLDLTRRTPASERSA
jgi:uncharacterized protein